jgi:hypothetical protein
LLALLSGTLFLAHELVVASPESPAKQTTTATNASLQSLVTSVESNSSFIVAENGTGYVYAQEVGFGQIYYNGTATPHMLMLYFDKYAPVTSSSPQGCVPTILSQLRVLATPTGQIQSINLVNKGLNVWHGTGPTPKPC